MSDLPRELTDVKREVVESRNQAIKTDNALKNLAFEVKGFERRFDALESRVRLSSVGVNLIVAGTIALAAMIVTGVRSHAFEGEIIGLKDAAREDHNASQAKTEALSAKLAEAQGVLEQQHAAADLALRVLTLLDNHQDKEASALLDHLDVSHLTELERRACGRRFEELQQRQADAAYRLARRAINEGQWAAAVPELKRALALNPNGRFSEAARYHLVWALWTNRQWAEVEPLARKLARHKDPGLAEEGRYVLATALARQDKREEARGLLQQVVMAEGRFIPGAKAYLSAMTASTPLPQDLPGGRVRLQRRADGRPPSGSSSAPAEGAGTPGAVEGALPAELQNQGGVSP